MVFSANAHEGIEEEIEDDYEIPEERDRDCAGSVSLCHLGRLGRIEGHLRRIEGR